MLRSLPATLAACFFVLSLAPMLEAKDAKDPIPRAKKPDEFDYLDTEDDAEAAKLLEKLVSKYGGEKGWERLRTLLEKKRPYPGRVPDRLTWDHACLDGKSRQVTWIAPSKISKRKPSGVLVFLHGAVRQPPPGGGANEAGMFAPAVKDLDLITVGPSTYEGVEWGDPACRELVHHALRVVKQTFNVDEDRVYLAGDSDGGRGAYRILETEATFFASAVPVIGAPGGVSRFANLKNVAFFAINGEKDSIFEVGRVREMVRGMKASGIDLLYKEIEGGAHDPRFFLTYQDEVQRFFRGHPRDPLPKTVHWELDPSEKNGTTFPADTFRWVRIVETGQASSRGTFDDGAGSLLRGDLPRIQATREGNRFEVLARNVKRFQILLAPEMVDLTQEVEVVVNGKEAWKGAVRAEAQTLLEEARRFLDRRLLFVARVEIAVD